MPVRKVTVTNANLLELSQGIGAIDNGYETTVDGKNVRRGFHLVADARYALARTAVVIKPLIEAWDKANKQAFEDHDPKVATDAEGKESRSIPASRHVEYQQCVTDLLGQKIELELPVLKVSDLKVGDAKGENAIPATALANLNPILAWPDADAGENKG